MGMGSPGLAVILSLQKSMQKIPERLEKPLGDFLL